MYKRLDTKAARLEARESYLNGYTRHEMPDADCLIATKEENGCFYLLAFDGTAAHPVMNYYYRTADARQRAIDEHIQRRAANLAWKATRKQAKDAAGKYTVDNSKPHFEPGKRYAMSYYNDDPWEHTTVIEIISRTACFVTLAHCYGERKTDEQRVKVACDDRGEYLSWGSFYYFRAESRCMTAEEQAETEKREAETQEIQQQNDLAAELAELEKIKLIVSENPVNAGDLYKVKIEWIEGIHEAAEYMEGREISIKAAEKIFSAVDAARVERGAGYDKWKFQILKSGESAPVWVDRYDMGDGNGGFLAFMRRYVAGRDGDFVSMVDSLEALATGNGIVSVQILPGLEKLLAEHQKKRKQDFLDILESIQFLTDEQLQIAVMMVSNRDPDALDVARFFFQELFRRDSHKAIETFRKWKKGQ